MSITEGGASDSVRGWNIQSTRNIVFGYWEIQEDRPLRFNLKKDM